MINKQDVAKLDRRVGLESQTETLDGMGEKVNTWTSVATFWAAKRSRPGREFFQAGRTIAEDLEYFIIRHRTGIAPAMRINDGGTLYDIVSIAESDKRAISMQLECRRVL